MFTLTIETDNDAFGRDPSNEIRRILLDLCNRIEPCPTAEGSGPLRDYNGNKVGRWELTEGTLLANIDRDGSRFEEKIGRAAHEIADAIVNPNGYADDADESNRRAEERDRLEAIARTTLEAELLG